MLGNDPQHKGNALVKEVKQISFLVSLILALNVVQTTTAAGPDDEFIRAYILISEGDNLAKSSQKKSAIQKYNQALNTLNTIKASNKKKNAKRN